MPYLWYLIEMHIKMTKRVASRLRKKKMSHGMYICEYVNVCRVFVLFSREPLWHLPSIKTKKLASSQDHRTVAYALVYIFIFIPMAGSFLL